MALQRHDSHPRAGKRPNPTGTDDGERSPTENEEFQWPGEEEMARLYGECAEEDRALAELGLDEYARALAGLDRE